MAGRNTALVAGAAVGTPHPPDRRGVDPIRIAGALWADLKAGGYHQGGSTITQQLSKMIFLTPEKTITRKVKEIAIALLLERRYSKERILELYLNQVYFGSRDYGLEAAAQAYFGKTAAGLSLAEGALLAALPIWVEFMRRTPSATLLAGPVPAN